MPVGWWNSWSPVLSLLNYRAVPLFFLTIIQENFLQKHTSGTRPGSYRSLTNLNSTRRGIKGLRGSLKAKVTYFLFPDSAGFAGTLSWWPWWWDLSFSFHNPAHYRSGLHSQWEWGSCPASSLFFLLAVSAPLYLAQCLLLVTQQPASGPSPAPSLSHRNEVRVWESSEVYMWLSLYTWARVCHLHPALPTAPTLTLVLSHDPLGVWWQQPSDAQPRGWGDSLQSTHHSVLPPPTRDTHSRNKPENPRDLLHFLGPRWGWKSEEPEEQHQEVSPCISSRPGLCFLPCPHFYLLSHRALFSCPLTPLPQGLVSFFQVQARLPVFVSDTSPES